MCSCIGININIFVYMKIYKCCIDHIKITESIGISVSFSTSCSLSIVVGVGIGIGDNIQFNIHVSINIKSVDDISIEICGRY